jgi:hypothetical protein
MNRTTTGLCLAAALSFAVSAGAQTSKSSDQDRSGTKDEGNIKVTGCLERGSNGNFILTNAQVSEGSNNPTGTSGTTSSSGIENTATWNLGGGNKKLDSHVGEKVEVTGRLAGESSMTPSYDTDKGRSGDNDALRSGTSSQSDRDWDQDHSTMSDSENDQDHSTMSQSQGDKDHDQDRSTTGTSGRTESNQIGTRGLDVKSVKRISRSCS